MPSPDTALIPELLRQFGPSGFLLLMVIWLVLKTRPFTTRHLSVVGSDAESERSLRELRRDVQTLSDAFDDYVRNASARHRELLKRLPPAGEGSSK